MIMTEKVKDNMKITAGTLLQLGSILAITVLSFALVKAQADENMRNISRSDIVQDDRWEEQKATDLIIKSEINELRVVQTEIRLSQREQVTHYTHILDEMKNLNSKIDRLEVVE